MARLGAGVRKREGNLYEKRFTFEGKRYSVYAPSQKELAEKEQELREQLKRGLYIQNKNITLDEYFKEWIEEKKHHAKGNTINHYKYDYYANISPKLGKRKIRSIERREIVALQKEFAELYKPKTANLYINMLSCMLNSAVNDEIITKNPCKTIKRLKLNKIASETIHRALTEEEQRVFMNELQGSFYYEFIAFMLCTGTRIGETSALTWQDINEKRGIISINKTVTYDENGKIEIGETPKTKAGTREIPLTDKVLKVLESQREKTKGLYQFPSNRIFYTVYGNIVRPNMINWEIREVLKRLEDKGTHIEKFTSHAFRDTFATRFIEQGGTLQTLKTILGHESLAMTADLYAHVLPNTKREEMEKIDIVI